MPLPSVRQAAALSLGLHLVLCFTSCSRPTPPGPLYAQAFQLPAQVAANEIFELTIQHLGSYQNRFVDVDLDAIFDSPQGRQRQVKGFYFGRDLWKVRFRPDVEGVWKYQFRLRGKGGFGHQGVGAFECTPNHADGPVRRDPENPYRWALRSGRPYFPVGLQDCPAYIDGSLGNPQVDGEGRSDLPKTLTWDQYFSLYGQAGFNLFRFSQKNCSYPLTDDLDQYREAESHATDQLLATARNHGFRVMFGIFGYHGAWAEGNRPRRVLTRMWRKALGRRNEAILSPEDTPTVEKEKRFVDYCVARWGVYVDFWELLNERYASDEWTTLMAQYLRSVDPDSKPISTSWEKPHLSAIDIHAPHWYETEEELRSDTRVVEMSAKWKAAGKPVIVAEQGNSGMNWDPRSAVRMRIRAWTALFQELGLVFWNTSWSKAGMHGGRYAPGAASNIYLGPEERGYIRVLQEFSARLDADVRMTPVAVTSPFTVRAYGLVSNSVAGAYLHQAHDHSTAVRGATVAVAVPRTGSRGGTLQGRWIDPSTGRIMAVFSVPGGQVHLQAPPFTVDLALLVS